MGSTPGGTMTKVLYHVIIYTCILAALAGCATAQRGAMSRARSGIENKDYEFALKRLSEAETLAETTPDLEAEIVYLRAICYEGLERHDDAIGALKYLVDKFPDTSYAYQAKEKLSKLRK
jgi:outer membrane protein assembly factor BamD (BamD/ComL family)